MTDPIRVLKLVECRPGCVFAIDWPGRWMPFALAVGLGCCVVGALGLAGALPLGAGMILIEVGVAELIIGPLLLTRGAWLAIDIKRGWVHWRRRWGRRLTIDSFSPSRLTQVAVVRAPSAIPLIPCWQVVLRVDHPRLGMVSLGGSWRRAVADRLAERVGQALGLLVVTDAATVCPGPNSRAFSPDFSSVNAWPNVAPPEVRVIDLPDAKRCLLLPNMTGLTLGGASFLAYAILWCLWSWTSLAVQAFHWIQDSGQGLVQGDGQLPALALMSAVALAGAGLLNAAVVRLLGVQSLRETPRGWRFARRWLGLDWGRHVLAVTPDGWLRAVTHPREQAGLWVNDGDKELQLAPGMESDTIEWLARQLKNAATKPGREG